MINSLEWNASCPKYPLIGSAYYDANTAQTKIFDGSMWVVLACSSSDCVTNQYVDSVCTGYYNTAIGIEHKSTHRTCKYCRTTNVTTTNCPNCGAP